MKIIRFKQPWIAFSLCLAAALAGCSNSYLDRSLVSSQIDELTASSSKTVDLSPVGSPTWSRLCVLTPYSSNQTAEDVLGFEWDAEKKTGIDANDSDTVLIFATNDNVEVYVNYPRADGDFSSVGSSCIKREQAKFARQQQSDGWESFVVAE